MESRRTSSPGDATILAREAYAEGIRNFIAVGGDGTAFEVLNGVFPDALEANSQVSLGLLALGNGGIPS